MGTVDAKNSIVHLASSISQLKGFAIPCPVQVI